MDYLQTPELWDELQELQDTAATDLDGADRDRLSELVDLFAELGNEIAVTQGVTLIPASEWKTYARDYAEEVAGDEAEFLFVYVDWDEFADSLQTDFQSITFDGTEYLYR